MRDLGIGHDPRDWMVDYALVDHRVRGESVDLM